MRRYLLYIAGALLAFGIGSLNVFCQKQISKEDYYQIFREANKKRFDTSRRESSQLKEYKDGKLLYTVEFVSEYLPPDKYHSVTIQNFNDSTKKNESIIINKIRYCRKDDGDWKQTNEYCGYGAGIGGPSNIISTKYTVKDTKINDQKAKLYEEFTVYKNNYSSNKDKEGFSFWQERYWLSEDGFILREESGSGLLEPERLYRQETITYEYNPKNLEIEAPIKQNR